MILLSVFDPDMSRSRRSADAKIFDNFSPFCQSLPGLLGAAGAITGAGATG